MMKFCIIQMLRHVQSKLKVIQLNLPCTLLVTTPRLTPCYFSKIAQWGFNLVSNIKSATHSNEGQPRTFHNPVEGSVVVTEPAGCVQVMTCHQGPGKGHQHRQAPAYGVVQSRSEEKKIWRSDEKKFGGGEKMLQSRNVETFSFSTTCSCRLVLEIKIQLRKYRMLTSPPPLF